jgi:hypothetical protein
MTQDMTTIWGKQEALERKNKSSTSGAVAVIEATEMQRRWRLWWTTSGSGGIDGGVGNGISGTVATVG